VPDHQGGPAVKRKRKPKLTVHEEKTLQRLKRDGCRLVRPKFRPTSALRSLIEKGYVRELPGLFNDTPQGYAPV